MPKASHARRRPLTAAERLEGRALLAADPFSIAVLPDTQYYSQKYPAIFNAQTQWVVDNLARERIAFVTQLGDIVQSGAHGTTRNALQWQRADAAMDLLDGDRAVNPDSLVAYSATLGNHDYDTVSDKLSGASRYQEFFGPARYQSRSWYTEDSGMPGNHAQVFTACSTSRCSGSRSTPTSPGPSGSWRRILGSPRSSRRIPTSTRSPRPGRRRFKGGARPA
jgi:hypothetical protein